MQDNVFYIGKKPVRNGLLYPNCSFRDAMSSGLAVIPNMMVPGSPGVSDRIANTRKATPGAPESYIIIFSI